MSKQKIYFITYATKQFNISAKHLINLTKISGLFEKSIYYKPKDLDSKFSKKFYNTLNLKRGAGYWIWKHHIIEKTLDMIEENDLIVYCDSGSSFNYFANNRFLEYVELLNDSKESNFRIECDNIHIEKMWTTNELFNYFDLNPYSKVGQSVQLEAGHMIFKKNNKTKEYFKIYNQLLDFDENLITDEYNSNKQIKEFKENRHDQSIFSILSKINGCISIPNETNFKHNIHAQHKFPFLALRASGHGIKDKIKFYTNFKKKKDLPNFFR